MLESEYKERAEKTGLHHLRANCWNISEVERIDFWERYVKNNGVAIQSTFGKLKESFSQTEAEIYIGKMKYIDYSEESFNSLNLFSLMLHKRRFYEAENELRSIVMIGNKGLHEVDVSNPPKVISIQTNLETLVEKIILNPDASKEFQTNVEKTTEKFGQKFIIEHSKLSEDPQ